MDVTTQFLEIEKIISKLDVENIDWIRYSKNIIHIKTIDKLKQIEFDDSIGLSYKYLSDKLFILIIFSGEFTYILSDQDGMSSTELSESLNYIIDVCDKIYIWNVKHLSKVIYNKNLLSKAIDTQILSNIILQKKDGVIDFQSEYHNQVKTFIKSVYKDDSYYYYIPRNILAKAMMHESISALVLGKLLFKICIKLNMENLHTRLLNFSITLSDIETGSIKINPKVAKKLVKSGLTFKKQYTTLIKYCSMKNSTDFPIEYRHLRSKTGRVMFDNKSGTSIQSLPDDECRKIIVPEFDNFMSMDIKAAEVFYMIKSTSHFLDDVIMDDNFDVYNHIAEVIGTKQGRSEVKNTIIKWFYGSQSFTSEEFDIKNLIEEKIPEIVPNTDIYVPVYYQTKYSRIIKVDKSLTKLLNNIPQSEFSDVMIDLVNKIWSNLRLNNLRTKIKFIIYDEIIFDCPDDEIEEVKNVIKLCTDSKLPYRVTIAKDWYNVSKKGE